MIWTTTPWTLPANLGIALHERIDYVRGEFEHPEDGRREDLVIAKDLLGEFATKTGFVLVGDGESLKGPPSKVRRRSTRSSIGNRK